MPKTPRTTSDPLGQKLLQVLREQGHADDLNFLAAQLGVTVQSTYDYIRHGRLAKERYPKLVEWSGRPLDWWFDVQTPAQLRATEVAATYAAWPVPGVSLAELRDALSPEQRAEVTGYLKALLAEARRTATSAADTGGGASAPSKLLRA